MCRIMLKPALVVGLLLAGSISALAYKPVCPAGWCSCDNGLGQGCCGKNSCTYSGGSCTCT
jgi:hypothetical protein